MFRFRQALLVTLLGMGAASLLIFPTEVAAAARESARLAFVSVLPTLFPFLIAADLLISLRVTNAAGRLLGGMMPRLFRQPREAAPVLLLACCRAIPSAPRRPAGSMRRDAAAQSRQSALWRCATIQAPPSLSVSSGRRCGIPPRWGGCFTAAILRRRCFRACCCRSAPPCPETPVQGARLRQSLFFPPLSAP